MRTLTVGNLTKEQTDIRKSLHFTFHQLTINKTKPARPGVHNNKSHEHKYIHINHNEKNKKELQMQMQMQMQNQTSWFIGEEIGEGL